MALGEVHALRSCQGRVSTALVACRCCLLPRLLLLLLLLLSLLGHALRLHWLLILLVVKALHVWQVVPAPRDPPNSGSDQI